MTNSGKLCYALLCYATMLCYASLYVSSFVSRSSIIIIMHYADFFAGHSRGGSVTSLMIKAAITMVNRFMLGCGLSNVFMDQLATPQHLCSKISPSMVVPNLIVDRHRPMTNLLIRVKQGHTRTAHTWQ
jgi:hypothetical protein